MPQERRKSEGFKPVVDLEDESHHWKRQIASRYEIKAAVWSSHGWGKR
jgi:hypothetical protein